MQDLFDAQLLALDGLADGGFVTLEVDLVEDGEIADQLFLEDVLLFDEGQLGLFLCLQLLLQDAHDVLIVIYLVQQLLSLLLGSSQFLSYLLEFDNDFFVITKTYLQLGLHLLVRC